MMTVAGIFGAESQTAVQPTGVMDCALAGTLGSVQGLFGIAFGGTNLSCSYPLVAGARTVSHR